MIHRFDVIAKDVDGNPIPGVAVMLELESKGSIKKFETCITNAAGNCAGIEYEAQRDSTLKYVDSYMSTAKVKGTKEGFYSDTKSALAYSDTRPGASAHRTINLRLIRPVDYLADGFATAASERELRERVLRFLNSILVESLLNEAEVTLKGIGTAEFKGRKYLRVTLKSTTVYNSLKVSKYEIGKSLFDETVRKVLNPLNDHIAAPRAYYGYDLVISGSQRDFSKKDSAPTRIEYRFLMPESVVRRYKDKDISGQALLDQSIQLMDDERIELRLQ